MFPSLYKRWGGATLSVLSILVKNSPLQIRSQVSDSVGRFVYFCSMVNHSLVCMFHGIRYLITLSGHDLFGI